jgi:hypothetical protein
MGWETLRINQYTRRKAGKQPHESRRNDGKMRCSRVWLEKAESFTTQRYIIGFMLADGVDIDALTGTMLGCLDKLIVTAGVINGPSVSLAAAICKPWSGTSAQPTILQWFTALRLED